MLLNDVRHRERLPRTRRAEERLEPVSAGQSGRQLIDGRRLVALGLERGFQLEAGQSSSGLDQIRLAEAFAAFDGQDALNVLDGLEHLL